MRLEREGVEYHRNGWKEKGPSRSIASCSRDRGKPLPKVSSDGIYRTRMLCGTHLGKACHCRRDEGYYRGVLSICGYSSRAVGVDEM